MFLDITTFGALGRLIKLPAMHCANDVEKYKQHDNAIDPVKDRDHFRRR